VRLRVVSIGDKTARRSLKGLAATIQLEGGRTLAVDRDTEGTAGELQADPWTFAGSFDLPLDDSGARVAKGRLVLVDGSRTDRIPLVLPVLTQGTRGSGREAYSTGRNMAALQSLASPLGRVLKRGESLRPAIIAPAPPPDPLHPWFLSIGAVACFLGFLAQRARP